MRDDQVPTTDDVRLLFLQPTTMHDAHRRLMDDHHRGIRWDHSTADALPETLRAGLADLWIARMNAEHRSIGIFAQYLLDLLAVGAPVEMLSLATRAQLDEVRHAELFCRVASLYAGTPQVPERGYPAMPEDTSLTLDQQVLREAMHLSVGSETWSSSLLLELHTQATDPVIRDVLAVVLSDEIHHARMGWSYLAARLAPDAPDAASVRSFVAGEVVPMIDTFVQRSFGDPVLLPPPSLTGDEATLARSHGYLPQRDEYRLFHRVIEQVWRPGFAALGIDASVLATRYAAPAWQD